VTIDLFIDTATGEISRTLTGPKLTSLVLTQGDIPDLAIRFVTSGALVTSTILASAAVMRCGLKAFPGSSLLASSTTHSLSGEVATAAFSLNTEELSDYFDDNIGTGQRTTPMFFEVEVTNSAGTKRLTHTQIAATVRRGVNNAGDLSPTAAALGLQRGSTSLSENDTTKAVTFTPAFSSAPTAVVAVVVAPTDGYVISVTVDPSWTASGFTARFGGAIPASGYKLNWIAVP